MPSVENGRVVFQQVPQGYPQPGKDIVYDSTSTIDLDNVALNGGFLVKTLILSIDPYLRGKMRDSKIKSYSAAWTLGQTFENFGVGVVIRSEHNEVKAGDHVEGILPFQKYTLFKKLENLRVLTNESNVPWSAYVGVLGMPGRTAYFGWRDFASPKKGEVLFVSAGAGAVGSFIVQLAKADGLKVIASAGSDDKVAFLKSIGADVAFNYKTENTLKVLEREGPINIYWDNVGGETLEAAIEASTIESRIICCGMISTTSTGFYPVKNLALIVGHQLQIFGVYVGNPRLRAKYEEEFYREVPKLVTSGKLKYTEHTTKGLENAGQAVVDILTGGNTGKSIVVVAEE